MSPNRRTAARRPSKRTTVPDPRFGRFCVGCGCCETIACPGGCGWNHVHPSVPVGVCSECPAYAPVLQALTAEQLEAIYLEKAAAAQEWA